MTNLAYPLQWPATWPRTAASQRRADGFKVSFAVARDELLHELRLLKATDPIISTNVELRQDGLPYARFTPPQDPGVAIYFTRRGDRLCVPCDSWMSVTGNLRAAGLAIAAMRGLERWGAGGMVTAAFTGFKQLPQPQVDSWWSVLELPVNATRADVDAAYKRLAMHFHPDVGGSSPEWLRLQRAYDDARMVTV